MTGPRVVVDCTAGAETAPHYATILAAGIGIVAANKQPFTGRLESWHELHDAARRGEAPGQRISTLAAAASARRHPSARCGWNRACTWANRLARLAVR